MNFNIPEFTVSEFSSSIKRVVEDSFGYVKIKGEVSGFKRASSGHLYFNLKDGNAVLSAVCFRSVTQLVNFEIADGLQICASGRITTFEGRSNYQIIVEKLEIAGIGAIMEMIEKRRQKLLAEGLFDDEHKKSIPFFPKIIGIVTSETGAVIEDIKHRIEARCPSHLLIYPTLVQGERAASGVISGIKYFNQLKGDKRPGVIIIARGGGSLEDMMPFNDEMLVREVFKSEIPIISAVGHETDTTLVDYVSDLRAPTPTAAAELATPVLNELKNNLEYLRRKLVSLPENFLNSTSLHLNKLQRYVANPLETLDKISSRLLRVEERLNLITQIFFKEVTQKLSSNQLSEQHLRQRTEDLNQKIEFVSKGLEAVVFSEIRHNSDRLENLSKLLKSTHYQEILKRGFAIIKNQNAGLISSVSSVKVDSKIVIQMHDGSITTQVLEQVPQC